MHLFLSLYNENTVISKGYTGPLDFDITGVDCITKYSYCNFSWKRKATYWLSDSS